MLLSVPCYSRSLPHALVQSCQYGTLRLGRNLPSLPASGPFDSETSEVPSLIAELFSKCPGLMLSDESCSLSCFVGTTAEFLVSGTEHRVGNVRHREPADSSTKQAWAHMNTEETGNEKLSATFSVDIWSRRLSSRTTPSFSIRQLPSLQTRDSTSGTVPMYRRQVSDL